MVTRALVQFSGKFRFYYIFAQARCGAQTEEFQEKHQMAHPTRKVGTYAVQEHMMGGKARALHLAIPIPSLTLALLRGSSGHGKPARWGHFRMCSLVFYCKHSKCFQSFVVI